MNYYYAHPAVGLQRMPDERSHAVSTLRDAELGVSWNLLSDDEKERLEESFFQLLLQFLSRVGDAQFSADFPLKDDRLRLSRMALSRGVSLRVDRSVVSGPLVPELINSLVATDPVELEVAVGRSARLEMHDGWTGVRVRLEDDELRSLRGILPGSPTGPIRR